jgi:hypothetical protein
LRENPSFGQEALGIEKIATIQTHLIAFTIETKDQRKVKINSHSGLLEKDQVFF